MASLDSQLGQIYIYNKKLSRSFVSVASEKVPETLAEIYTITEVAQLNGAAGAEYEKLSKILAASLRKNFRSDNPDAFENSIAQANEQLAGMAAEGSASWVGRLNALLAARRGDTLSVATSGKIHAYLLREGQLSDLADSPKKQDPLKTFENFAIGKIQRHDFLIFSTAELLNYVSAERIQALLTDLPLAAACDSIAVLVRDNADDQTSFGTMVIEVGYAEEFRHEDGKKIADVLASQVSPTERAKRAWGKISEAFAHTVMIARSARVPSIKAINAEVIREHAKNYADLRKLRDLPRAKKFFLISAAVCAVLLIADVATTIHAQNAKKIQAKITQQLSSVEQELNGANNAYMYGDQATAMSLLNQAKSDLSHVLSNSATNAKLSQLNKEAVDMDNAIAHIHTTDAKQIVSYSGASIDTFVSTGPTLYLVNKSGALFVPYNIANGNGKTAKDFTLSLPPITNIATVNSVVVFTDKNGALYQLNPNTQSAVKQAVTLPAGSRGLAFYGTPTKVYTIDRGTNRIVASTFASTKAPTSYLKQATTLDGALDLSVDGSAYVLGSSAIQKYSAGLPKAFNSPTFTLGDPAKIYTTAGMTSLFVLDTQNNAVVEVDKTSGKILNQYKPGNVKNIQAFTVDAPSGTTLGSIYVLDNQTIYQIAR